MGFLVYEAFPSRLKQHQAIYSIISACLLTQVRLCSSYFYKIRFLSSPLFCQQYILNGVQVAYCAMVFVQTTF